MNEEAPRVPSADNLMKTLRHDLEVKAVEYL